MGWPRISLLPLNQAAAVSVDYTLCVFVYLCAILTHLGVSVYILPSFVTCKNIPHAYK